MDVGRWRGDCLWLITDAGHQGLARLDAHLEVFDDRWIHDGDLFGLGSQSTAFATQLDLQSPAGFDIAAVAGLFLVSSLAVVGNGGAIVDTDGVDGSCISAAMAGVHTDSGSLAARKANDFLG